MAESWLPADGMAPQTRRPSRVAPLAGRGWRWLDARGLQSLGTAGIAAVVATVLFAIAGLLRSTCSQDCSGYVAVPAGVAGTLATLAVLAGLAAVGHWIGHLTQRTWLERLHLELAGLELDAKADKERQRRLLAVSAPDGKVVQIHARGRVSLWTGLPVAVAALIALPFSAASFGSDTSDSPYLFPLLALALVAALAATVRGWALLRATRRLVEPRAAQPAKPPRRTAKRESGADTM